MGLIFRVERLVQHEEVFDRSQGVVINRADRGNGKPRARTFTIKAKDLDVTLRNEVGI